MLYCCHKGVSIKMMPSPVIFHRQHNSIRSKIAMSRRSHLQSPPLLLLLLLLLGSKATSHDSELNPTTHYDVTRTGDGAQCTWLVMQSTPGKNVMVMTCRCKDADGQSQGYTCQYEGGLQECEEYQTHAREVSEALVKVITGL